MLALLGIGDGGRIRDVRAILSPMRKVFWFSLFVSLLAWCGRDGVRHSGNRAGIGGGQPQVQPSIPSANGGTNRRGAFENELVLNPGNVAGITKKGSYSVDARVWAQPLYLQGVTIAGVQRDCLLVATMGNSLYLFDANSIGSSLWSHLAFATTLDRQRFLRVSQCA